MNDDQMIKWYAKRAAEKERLDALARAAYERDCKAAEYDRLRAENAELREACETFVAWLDREDVGFDHRTHDRTMPAGEAAWRAWYDGNMNLCRLAQDRARAVLAKHKEQEHD